MDVKPTDPSDRLPSGGLSRRDALRATAGLLAVALGPASLGPASLEPAHAADDPGLAYTAQYLEALAKLAGDRKPTAARIKLDLPDLAENGNMVPFTVGVESPMTPEDNVRWLAILSTGNPQALIGTFTFTPTSGRATASGRLRLARTQDVIAVAELSDGSLVSGIANVKVTVGGCGAG
jgi:sulfur-oxidizing protein SoxY